MTSLCDDANMQELLQAMAGDLQPVDRAEALLEEFPEDPRLHFLRGSMLIGKGRLIEAHSSLSRAVALAPDFDIARFQLGFFQLTSGEADKALDTWGRLDRLADTNYLRKFVDGLRCLIRDDFAGAVASLRAGIVLNQENPPLNRDMELLISQCEPLINGTPSNDGGEVSSQTSLILQQFTDRSKVN